jgi:2-keto-4-pentenoate hydratase/2-oxohepta-3-ene-1,7-dioic acid hydratase in catechol pathway
MKFCSFIASGVNAYGIVHNDEIRAVGEEFAARYPDLKSAIAANALVPAAQSARTGASYSLDAVRFMPLIPRPAKILCVGMNYMAHIREMGREPPEYPAIFIRFADSLVGHGESTLRPGVSGHYDFEGELAVIIGRAARYVKAADALDYVAGYTCFMDGSVRDFQRHTTQFTAGKNFPASGALGPWLVTKDELPDPRLLKLETRVSGEVMQTGDIDDLCIDIPAMIEYISTMTPLAPGDVIATGTPSGVGAARTPPRWLQSGDIVEVDIDGIGILRTTVADE